MKRLILSALVLFLACSPTGRKLSPNLLLVTIDTLRQDAVGCHGAPAARTPAFDRLAREGVQFARASCQVPITLPSHTTLFTGLCPARSGVRHNGTPIPLERTTLAEILAERGYETAGFVGAQVLSGTFQVGQGFATFDDRWEAGEGRIDIHGLAERRGDSVAAAFVRWFEHRDRKRPFFAWVHFYDPHAPYDPPPPFGEAARGDYAGETAFADRALGAVLSAVEREGLLDRTLVVAVSDHGEGLGLHGEEEHGLLLYETTLAIPWVLRLPGGPRGKVVDAPVETVDLLPTLAPLMGIDPDPTWSGRNLLPLIRGGDEGGDRPVFSETLYGNVSYGWAPLRSVRRGDWKLVRGRWDDLFDLARDPAETRNLASEAPEIAAGLGDLLEEFAAGNGSRAAEAAALSAEQEALLEALGYVAPRAAPAASPDLPDPRERIAAHDLLMRRRLHELEGRMDLARADIEEALRIDPKNLDALIRMAPYFRESGEAEKEKGVYLAILSVDPNHAPAWNNLGVIEETEGDLDGALACYERSIQCDPRFADAYVNRGNVYVVQGRLEEAMSNYETGIRLNPRSGPAHYGKAMIYERRGDLESLVGELKAALHVDPTLVQAQEWLRSLQRSTVTGN
jgi:arylsulfatase A-like enzyme